MKQGVWRGRKVFCTGHTGFKGGWLSLWLHGLGARVRGFSLPPPTQPSMFDAVGIEELVDHVVGDIRDFDALSRAMVAHEPEVVFHLAAQPLVRESYRDPLGTYATNVMGTANLLEAVRLCQSARAVVVVTTDKCYENREWEWGYRENEPMGGHDPYASSKGCAELVTAAYRRSFFDPSSGANRRVAIASARAGNVIGGGDWAQDRLIPDIVRSFSKGEPVVIRSPHATRPWQHVLEPLSGYLELAERLLATDGEKYADGWNFGPEATVRVKSVVDRVATLWGEDAKWVVDDATGPHEATLLHLDISKAKARLGWHPILSLDLTLEWVVDWYRAWFDGDVDLRRLSIEQIDDYEARSRALEEEATA